MRVLLDATAMPAERVGVAHYVLGLSAGLSGRDDVDLHLLAKRADAPDLRAAAPRATVHLAAPRARPARLLWEQTLAPARIRRIAPDVYHGPHYTLPAVLRCPAVVTFHDPTFFTHPHLHERAKVAYFTRMARLAARRARRVIAISEYAKAGAVRHAGADAGRVDVVHHGIDLERYRPDGDERSGQRVRAKLGVPGRYLFWVGAIEPRKDVPTLVRAFEAMNGDLALVLAGRRAWGAAEVDEAVASSPVRDRIIRPGYITEDEKIALYQGAVALVYPSIAEGFGFQVLEAMACGCPVVTTTGSAPEEIAGEAAELVAPGDHDSIAAAARRIAGDAGRAGRLRAAGLARAARFTWAAAAEATVSAYRAAL